MSGDATRAFPDGFRFGVATSAYQVEGATDVDGRGESIWDRFTATPAHIANGDTAEIACDHYRRWRSDVDLLGELGVNAYRFSLSWPRLVPAGDGAVERRGIEHYDRLIDALLERGITPLPTLYHWDLPQALQERGGWRARETADRFADYAAVCAAAYGDRVPEWVTVNEPWIVGLLGHRLGLHAPGEQSLRASVEAMHHLLLGHGRASQALRSTNPGVRTGVAFSLLPNYPASDDPADAAAARASDGYVNRWFLDPVLTGTYPDDMRQTYERLLGDLDMVREGDLAVIASGGEFIGVNFYTDRVMRADRDAEPFPFRVVDDGAVSHTEAHTRIVPHALTDLLVRLRHDYGDIPVLITENGCVYGDAPGPDGRVHDARRSDYLHQHLAAVLDAVAQGCPVRGYYHWSFMDNFEWALGYQQRFGLVHVDYATQQRTIKDSGRYYARIAAAQALLPPSEADR